MTNVDGTGIPYDVLLSDDFINKHYKHKDMVTFTALHDGDYLFANGKITSIEPLKKGHTFEVDKKLNNV